MSKEIEQNVSRETFLKLSSYVDLLLKWNKNINLISKNTIPNLWIRHILDSAQLMNFIEDKSQTVLDVGAGSGLPGIILSILGVEKTILVESNGKKCSFLTEVSRILHLNTEVISDRIENIQTNCDIVVARGFADLDDILDKLQNIKYKRILLLKGETAELEIEKAQKRWNFECQKYASITNTNSKILDITNVHKKSD